MSKKLQIQLLDLIVLYFLTKSSKFFINRNKNLILDGNVLFLKNRPFSKLKIGYIKTKWNQRFRVKQSQNFIGHGFGFFGLMLIRLTSIQISNKKKHGLHIGDFMLIKLKNSFIYLLLKRYMGQMYKKTKKNFKR